MSSSSSSSMCCNEFTCNGVNCSHFSSWSILGVSQSNSNNCELYVIFDVFGSLQQVEIYKDPSCSYESLVALGRNSSTNIVLNQKNSSGVSGSVVWDLTLVSYPSASILTCEALMSSSSSSSFSSESSSSSFSSISDSSGDSISSSSTSSSSSSSSISSNSSFSFSSDSSSESSGCCVFYECSGVYCQYLTNWILYGVKSFNSNNCSLYVVIDTFSLNVQIRLYSDSELASLVAIGEGPDGTITLNERNSSGIYGSVDWDGSPIPLSTKLTLDCNFSSSSSESSSSLSSSSISSSSSSSSVDSSSTSSSSYSSISSESSSGDSTSSTLSFSSMTSSSSSSTLSTSSSSIDSSTSSSESIGNVSTSSSSSMVEWNRAKPLILAQSSISIGMVKNRIAQTIYLKDDSYDIGDVYLYLYGRYGSLTNYNLNLDIFECDDNGKPITFLATSSIPVLDVSQNNWYAFNFGLKGTTPSNRFLAFVFWQDGGSENDYVEWGYYDKAYNNAFAFYTNDLVNWEEYSGVSRAIKIVGIFDVFDLTNYNILSNAASLINLTDECVNGDLDGLYLYGNNVGINNSPTIISCVVDCSGSMGWNDRTINKVEVVSEIIDRFQNYYNGYSEKVLFDIIRFGGQFLDSNSILDGIGQYLPVNLDLSNPTRTTYVFSCNSSSFVAGDIYKTNDLQFEVLQSNTSSTNLISIGNTDPYESGVLIKASGSGSDTIAYTSYSKASMIDSMVSYGFKNLEQTHTYCFAGVYVDSTSLTGTASLNNWNVFTNGASVTLTLSNGGPGNASSIDFTTNSDNSLHIRKAITDKPLVYSRLTQDVSVGDSVIYVENASIYANNAVSYVDIVDGEASNIYCGIMASNTIVNTITIAPVSSRDIQSGVDHGGIVSSSGASNGQTYSATTLSIFTKDSSASSDITFYFETKDGYKIEWDFRASSDWKKANIYWMGDTAVFPIYLYDEDGVPFPDNTEVYLYVDKDESNNVDPNRKTYPITRDALKSQSKIYIDNSEQPLTRNTQIDIVDNNNQLQTATIFEVDPSNTYIIITPPLLYDFYVSNGSKITRKATEEDVSNVASETATASILAYSPNIVDVTPIWANKNIPVRDYDLTPVTPSTQYKDLNQDIQHVRSGSIDVPIIDGHAVIRILPITEDNLKTKNEKDLEASNLLNVSSQKVYNSQIDENSNDIANATSTTTTSTVLENNNDYVIDSPVYSIAGYAESTMQSYSTNLELQEIEGLSLIDSVGYNLNPPTATILAKKYVIYPYIVTRDSFGVIQFVHQLDSFNIYFTPPISVTKAVVSNSFNYWVSLGYCSDNDVSLDDPCIFPTGCCTSQTKFKGYFYATMPGVFAGTDSSSIEYTVLNRSNLLQTGTMTVRIFQNPVINLDNVMEYILDGSMSNNIDYTICSRQDFYITPQNDITVDDTLIEGYANTYSNTSSVASLIGDWRAIVQNNKVSVQTNEKSSSFEWFSNPTEWTYAYEYGSAIYEQTVNVVNGKATVTIPSSFNPKLLMVQASVFFGENNEYEYITSNLVVVSNPISVSPIYPQRIYAKGGDSLYEIGGNVLYYGNVISDNVSVIFSPENTSINPSTSKTSNGWAGGSLIGPHVPVSMGTDNVGIYENVTVNIDYMGFTLNSSRLIEWIGEQSSTAQQEQQFYFHVQTDNPVTYADGGSQNPIVVSSDLNIDGRDYIQNISYGTTDDMLERMLGFEQPRNLPNTVYYRSSSNLTMIPSSTAPVDGLVSSKYWGLNQNIGYRPSELEVPASPWEMELDITTHYHYTNEQNASMTSKGIGVIAKPYFDGEKFIIPRPYANFTEPLEISLNLEQYGSRFIRDGNSTGTIIADVTWKGEPITGYFENGDGSKVKYPFPKVTFVAGICGQLNQDDSDPPQPIDNRGHISDCYRVDNYNGISLSSYECDVSLSRTDVNNSFGIIHTHECVVDDYGYGNTTSTIILQDVITDHTHVIEDYIAQEVVVDGITHSHNLRSVAQTILQPFADSKIEVVVNGYVVYDPTDCKPYGNEVYVPNRNRMMFSSLILPSPIKDRTIEFEFLNGTNLSGKTMDEILQSTSSWYTAKTVNDTDKGMDIKVSLRVSEYSVEVSPGNWVTFPSQYLPDGSRCSFSINAYKPKPKQNINEDLFNGATVIRPDETREYMLLTISATVNYDNQIFTADLPMLVSSNMQWIPAVSSLVSNITNDSIYLGGAISNCDKTLGSSQIYDALVTASQRLIDYNAYYSNNVSYNKAILLLTDGDENTSTYSIQQAMDYVGFIDGKCGVPVIPVRFGYAYGSDEISLQKIASDSCGHTYYSVNYNDFSVSNTVSNIISDGYLNVNKGVFSSTIDLEDENMLNSLSLNNNVIPSGSQIFYRFRFSSDNISWSDWSGWNSYDYVYILDNSINSVYRYVQYEIELRGSGFFESPILTEGLRLGYYNKNDQVVFFEPIYLDITDKEYLSSIHINHEATIPETSMIDYGITQSSSNQFSDYYGITQPIIQPDRQHVLLTRYNELLTTSDMKTYYLLNGSWSSDLGVVVYKRNADKSYSIIDSSTYSVNSSVGCITFNDSKSSSDIFMASLDMKPYFRIACHITNYGTSTASVHSINIMYNIGKRIPIDQNGIIINTPIRERT